MRRRRSHDPTLPAMRQAAGAGFLATMTMDVGALAVLAPLFGTHGLGAAKLGRWIGHMRKGRFNHADIAAATPVGHEAALGVAAHYATGIALGAVYGLLLRGGRRPNSLPLALGYGMGSTALAWFVVFPACGQGLMGVRRGGLRLGAFAFCTHTLYGLGLGLALERRPPWLGRATRCSPGAKTN